jgi:hypothetical protein
MLHVLYLVHDLCDPATGRRVAMLQAGGARVTLAGFRRHDVVPDFDGIVPIDLGMTSDRAFGQRLLAVARAALTLGARLKGVARPDVIIGRNLEMLALSNRVRTIFGADMPVVYECLDIHRLLLGQGHVSRAMRGAERFFGRDSVLLLTSSPAFIRDYFEPYGQSWAPVMLIPNKMLELDDTSTTATPPASSKRPDEPWRIGWFGALRCAKSLELLAAFTRATQGRFEVVLRGRPAHVEFDDFDGFVQAEPHMRFEGAYRNPGDLPSIYGEVHFSWAIDFFEEGMNSNWLLPNRLYEGGRFGVVPIAMNGTETARFLTERRLGLLLEEATVEALVARFGNLTPGGYGALRDAMMAQAPETWICGPADCRRLVEKLRRVASGKSGEVLLEAAA